MKDNNNMDVFVQCTFRCPTLDESVESLEAGIKKVHFTTKSIASVNSHHMHNRTHCPEETFWIGCLRR